MMFAPRDSHNYNWSSLDGKTQADLSHIDRQKMAFEYTRLRSLIEADYDTEKYLLVANVRERLAVSKQAATEL